MFDQAHFVKGKSHWLPFGVDTNIFHPPVCLKCGGKRAKSVVITSLKAGASELCDECFGAGYDLSSSHKDVGVGFIGAIYGKREVFLRQFAHHLTVKLHVGAVEVRDIDGLNLDSTVRRLAYNYSRCKVFFNLPALSNLIVTKIYEAMACGAMMVTPALSEAAAKNMEQFEHIKHLLYYRPENMGFVNQILKECVERNSEREARAIAGYREVREKHNLEKRMEELLTVMGLEVRGEKGKVEVVQ